MDSVYSILFRPWLSQEKIDIALATKRENFIYCRYRDMKKNKDRTGMLNEVTQEILFADPRPTIGLKMFGMAVVMTPDATVFRLGMHILKYPYTIVKIFVDAIKGFVSDLTSCRFKEAFYNRLIVDLTIGLIKEIVGRPLKVIRTIWFSIALEMAAIIGFMISPDRGKRLYSLIESELNYGLRRSNVPNVTSGLVKQFFETEVLWIAICPHPHAILKSDTYVDSEGKTLPRYKVLTRSANLDDFPNVGNCENAPNYFIYPCIPCFT